MPLLSLGTCMLPVGLDGQSKTKNIAEMLVERGLAATQAHRSDDERSCHYEVYIEAENRAKKDKKGMQVDCRISVEDILSLAIFSCLTFSSGLREIRTRQLSIV